MLGFILHYVGRSEEAVACIERAIALDPFCSDMVLHFQGQALYQLGRYPEAVGVLKRRIVRNPETDASRALLPPPTARWASSTRPAKPGAAS